MLTESLKQRLDAGFAAYLEATQIDLPDGFEPTVAQMRGSFAAMASAFSYPLDQRLQIQTLDIRNRDGQALPLRLYRHREPAGSQPCVIYLHGGGWVLGNLDTHASICSDLAIETGCAVLAVDYRLAPEHPFPAALNDCIDAIRHVHVHGSALGIDTDRLALVGDSAGGNLAAASALSLRGGPVTLAAQVLIYPALGADTTLPAFAENRDVPGLSEADIIYFFTRYIGSTTALPDPLAAPLTVEDLADLPPTLISAAEYDPLRDDGRLFAERMRAAGGDVELRVEPGVGHSYLWVRRQSVVASSAFDAVTAFLRERAPHSRTPEP